MAVPEQTPYIEHTGNGVTTSFALKFQCESKDHLIVLVDEIEPPIATWSLTGGNVVFTTAPALGKKIVLQRNTPFSRTTDYQSYNNSFRPPAVNKDFDWIWLKLQELGVADWILSNRIDALKNYVDDRDDELRAYLMEEIRKQGVALDQLDDYYNYLMQRLAQIAVDKGWDASFVVDGDKTQKQINDNQKEINQFLFPFYSLRKFDVKGDGVTDDCQAIQDAVNFMSSIGGGTLVAPAGEFLLDSKTTETNVNADCLVKWKPNVSLVGLGQATKFKVGKFANSKFYAFYNYTDDLGSCSFKDFWFDGNGGDNPALASSGYDQWNIAIARANQIRLDGVNFYNAAGRQIVGLGTNSLLPTVKEVFINNCRVHKVATDITGNDLQADHSSFYITASYAEIKGNILRNDAPNAVATAIECHTVKAVIDGNIIDNYNLGVITAATVRSIDDHVITNNIIKANMCWQPWVYNNHDVKRALFANNTCLQTTGAAGRNILDIANRITSACTGIFSILNNTIVGSNIAEAQAGQHAIGIGDIATYKISGNTFRNVTGRVLSLGTLYSSNVVDIDFTDNKVENCNLTTNASYKEVIGFNSSGSIKGLKIKGNTFRSDSAVYSNRLFYGVCSVANFEFTDNAEEGTGFTINPSWSADKFTTSIIHHTTKNEAKPTVPASPTSTWKIIAPTGAALREYTRRIGSTATNFWSAIHYVNNAAPSGFDSVAGDRAHNNQPAIGRPIEWICTVAGTPGTWVPSGYIGTPTTTTTALQAIGNTVNTVDKFNGKQIINSSDNKIYYAVGPTAADAWKSFDGVTTITPA